VAEVLAPEASGLAIAREEEPLKSKKSGAWPPSRVIGSPIGLATGTPKVILSLLD